MATFMTNRKICSFQLVVCFAILLILESVLSAKLKPHVVQEGDRDDIFPNPNDIFDIEAEDRMTTCREPGLECLPWNENECCSGLCCSRIDHTYAHSCSVCSSSD